MVISFQEAFEFVFEETFEMWKSDLEKIFKIGTQDAGGGCNLSSCILVLIGIESFAHCFSDKKQDASAVEEFVDENYPSFYHGKMKKIHELFRHGLAHNYYPKSEFNLINVSKVSFGVYENGLVFPLDKIKEDIESCRHRVLDLTPKQGKPYIVAPQVLFVDTVNVMNTLKEKVTSDPSLQGRFVKNCEHVKRTLRHISSP